MNKKVNTLLFVLCATVFNILITFLSFILLILLYTRFLSHFLPNESHQWAFMLIFIAAIAIAFFIYRVLFKFISKKFDFEKYFDPIFTNKRIKKY